MKYITTRISGFLNLFFNRQSKIGSIPTYEYLLDDDNAEFQQIDFVEEWD